MDLLDADVARDKDARDLRAAVLIRRDVARLRQRNLSNEEIRIRQHADVDEDAVHGQRLPFSRILVQEIDGREAVLAVQMLNLRLEHHRHLRIGIERILRGLVRAQLRAVDEIEMACILREEVRGIDRRVAAAHDGDYLILVRVAVAELAVVHAAVKVMRLLREREFAAVHAGGDDDHGRLVDVCLRFHDFRRGFEIDTLDAVELVDLGTEIGCLLLEGADQLHSAHALEARIVLDVRRRCDLSADERVLEDERPEIHAPRVERCSQPRHAGADDNNILLDVFLWHRIISLMLFDLLIYYSTDVKRFLVFMEKNYE